MIKLMTEQDSRPLVNSPILSVICDEPEGEVERYVRRLTLDIDVLRIMWEKSREFKTLFNEEIRDDFGKFLNVFLNQTIDGSVEPKGLFWVVDDFVGLFYLTNIISNEDASAHYTFYDRRHKGRVELVKAMIRYVFMRYNFRRLSTEVPVYALNGPLGFAKELGFKQEGTKRKAASYQGKWFDVVLFGILREEALKVENI